MNQTKNVNEKNENEIQCHDSYCDHELTEYNKRWANMRLRRGLELHTKRIKN